MICSEIKGGGDDYKAKVLDKASSLACSYFEAVEDASCGFEASYAVLITFMRSQFDGNVSIFFNNIFIVFNHFITLR